VALAQENWPLELVPAVGIVSKGNREGWQPVPQPKKCRQASI
jgi:hypothetical protein